MSRLGGVDIIAVTETWLQPNHINFFNLAGFVAFHNTRDEGSIGGGVALYIHKKMVSADSFS